MSEFFSKKLIKEVWKYSKDGKDTTAGASGIDGVTARDFRRNLDENITSIYTDIKKNTFRFQKLRLVTVPKGDDAFRIIAIPTVRDRLVQRVVQRYFMERPHLGAATPISYGSVRGRGVDKALSQAVEYRNLAPIVLKTDITKFFDTINREKLKNSIPKRVCRSVKDILLKAIDCEIHTSDLHEIDILKQNEIQVGLGLRQGMPLSPLLSNFYLKRFDHWLVKQETFCVRYVDDICIFKTSEKECLILLDRIKNELKRLRLNIPEISSASKTNIVHATDSLEILGVEIRFSREGYRLCPQFKKLPKIEKSFQKIGTVSFCKENKISMHKIMQKLDAMYEGQKHALKNITGTEEYLQKISVYRDNQKKAFLTEFFGDFLDKLDDVDQAILGLKRFS